MVKEESKMGKHFIETNMSSNLYAFSLGVKTMIAMMYRVITKENTQSRKRIQLVAVIGTKIRKTLTT